MSLGREEVRAHTQPPPPAQLEPVPYVLGEGSGIGPQEDAQEVDADQAAALEDRPRHVVGEVPLVLETGREVRVAGENRDLDALRGHEVDRIARRLGRGVRQIECDPAVGHELDQGPSVRLEADRRRVAAGETVLAVPGERDVEDPADLTFDRFEAFQAAVERLVLLAEDRGVLDRGDDANRRFAASGARFLDRSLGRGVGRSVGRHDLVAVLLAQAPEPERLVRAHPRRPLLRGPEDGQRLEPDAAGTHLRDRAPRGRIVGGRIALAAQVGQQVAVEVEDRRHGWRAYRPLGAGVRRDGLAAVYAGPTLN